MPTKPALHHVSAFFLTTLLGCLAGATGCAADEEPLPSAESAQQKRLARDLSTTARGGLGKELRDALETYYDKDWLDRRRMGERGSPTDIVGSDFPADDDEQRMPAKFTLAAGQDKIECDEALCKIDLASSSISSGKIPDVLQRAILLANPPDTFHGASSDAVLSGAEGKITCVTASSDGFAAVMKYTCNFDIAAR